MNAHVSAAPKVGAAPTTAILFAGWGDTPLGLPGELVPLAGRSLLQRSVERLVRAGISRIEVALGESTRALKAFLGDGSRWGCGIRCHTPSAGESLHDLCRRLALDPGSNYALASASMMPLEAELALNEPLPATSAGRALVWEADGKANWTGWGTFTGEWLFAQEAIVSHVELGQRLLELAQIERRHTEEPLATTSPAELLRSQKRLLDGAAPAAGNAGPGRGCQIHPSARIVAPVHIGQHVRIGANAIVGPYASIGDGALIDREAQVANSVILPATYVGEDLEIIDAVVAGDRLANARLDTVVRVAAPGLLSATSRGSAGGQPPGFEKALARALRIVLAPLQA